MKKQSKKKTVESPSTTVLLPPDGSVMSLLGGGEGPRPVAQLPPSTPTDEKDTRRGVNSVTASTTAVLAYPQPPPPTASDGLDDESGFEGEEDEGAVSAQNSRTGTPTDSKTPESEQVLSKKAQFRRYLTKSGFKYAIIRTIVALYEDHDKPDDVLEWITGFMGSGIPTPAALDKFRAEAKEIREKIEKLQQENSELKSKLDELESVRPADSLADQELKKMIEELTESGALPPTPILDDQLPGIVV